MDAPHFRHKHTHGYGHDARLSKIKSCFVWFWCAEAIAGQNATLYHVRAEMDTMNDVSTRHLHMRSFLIAISTYKF